jgi:RES domain-containing protein
LAPPFGPFDPAFLDALESVSDEGWSGYVWRAVIGESAPLRSNTRGARWSPAGVEALYSATSAEAAEAEIRHLIARQSIEVTKPVRLYRLRVHLTRVARVVNTQALRAVGISLEALLDERWDLPQKIAAAVDWMGIPGLLVPGARHPDPNLVILVNRLTPDDAFELDEAFTPKAVLMSGP